MSILLALHVGGATLGLAAGTASLVFSKGSARHKAGGRVFVAAMLVMAATAAPLASFAGKWLDVLSSMLTIYLLLTSLTTMHRVSLSLEVGLLAMGLVTLSGYLAVEWIAIESGVRRPDVPPGAGFVFATVLAIAAIGDVRRLAGWRPVGGPRIARHLWRMCFALFMATASFFGARAHLFPDLVRQSGLLALLAVMPLLLMFFWLAHTRLKNRQLKPAA